MTAFVVAFTDPNYRGAYGPFASEDEAQRFATFLSAEVDTAEAKRLLSPVAELLNWRDHVAQKRADEELAGDWLIWSHEHNAWWAPDSAGYRTDDRDAGRYTRAEAEANCHLREWRTADEPPEVAIPAPSPSQLGAPGVRKLLAGLIDEATRATVAAREAAKVGQP